MVDGRQFDTVYGKHISVAITSRGKQASLQREVGDASVVGESERVDGEELLANPLLLLPPLLHPLPSSPCRSLCSALFNSYPKRSGGCTLDQRLLIYLAYRVLSDSSTKNTVYASRPCTLCSEISNLMLHLLPVYLPRQDFEDLIAFALV